MSIRESIANMKPGDRLVVDCRNQASYVRVLARENGRQVKQLKSGGAWELFCTGYYKDATLAWMKRLRAKREWWRRNRGKV